VYFEAVALSSFGLPSYLANLMLVPLPKLSVPFRLQAEIILHNSSVHKIVLADDSIWHTASVVYLKEALLKKCDGMREKHLQKLPMTRQ